MEGWPALGEVTSELRLSIGIGDEAGEESEGRVFQEDGTACVTNGRLNQGWGYETVLASNGTPASPRANPLSEGRPVGFQTLPFLGGRLEPWSPADKQLPQNPILKAPLGSS